MKKLTANWGLKLASLIFAIAVWFLVTNINDPITSVRYTNIPVTLKNTNLITDKGQVYTILDGSDTINSVTIFAPRSIIDSISQNNIVASADIQDLSSLNTVSINVQTNKYFDRIDHIVSSSDVVKLSVERKASKSLALGATTSGNLADGYVIGDVTTEQNMVRISGPESVVNNIKSASVDVDVTGFTSNIGTDADIVLLDVDGNIVDSSQVTMNIKTVRVNVVIYETKYVPVTCVVKGEPANGYTYTGRIETTPDSVQIAGRSSTISAIEEITVDDEWLDISGMTGNLTNTFDIRPYLPTGVNLADKDFNGSVSVSVYISPILNETLDISIANIAVDGAIEGYNIYIVGDDTTTVPLTVEGLREIVGSVSPSAITGTVSLDSIMAESGMEVLEPGTYLTNVRWNLPDGVSEKGTSSVYVTVEAY